MADARPAMPIVTAQDLRARYLALPPKHVRWKLRVGADFLTELADLVDNYGVRQCAVAIGVSESGVHAWLNRRISAAGDYPSQADLRELRQAWRKVQAMRVNHQYVSRTTPLYEQVHRCLKVLMERFDMEVIGAALGERSAKVKHFLHPPGYSVEERMELSELFHLQQRLRQTSANSDEFFRVLADTRQRISASKIARYLGLDIKTVLALDAKAANG